MDNNIPKRREVARYKRAIRRLTALVVVLSITCVALAVALITKGSGDEKNPTASSQIASSDTASVSSLSAEEKALQALAADLNSWQLKLVNAKNPLPEGFSIETTTIAASYARDVGMSYDARAVSNLNAMCSAAKADGINLLVISSFRTHSRQTSLYYNQVDKMRARYPNLSDEEIKKKASTVSAFPGTSEHELGLAVDFNSVEESFEGTEHFRWLKAHAEEYGFVMRYAKEKESITGIIYEPWHYRYVGQKHAKKMNELGYCLEEYIDYLKDYTK